MVQDYWLRLKRTVDRNRSMTGSRLGTSAVGIHVQVTLHFVFMFGIPKPGSENSDVLVNFQVLSMFGSVTTAMMRLCRHQCCTQCVIILCKQWLTEGFSWDLSMFLLLSQNYAVFPYWWWRDVSTLCMWFLADGSTNLLTTTYYVNILKTVSIHPQLKSLPDRYRAWVQEQVRACVQRPKLFTGCKMAIKDAPTSAVR